MVPAHAMKWVLILLIIAAWICISVYLITGYGWEIGGPLTAALAGVGWWLGVPGKTRK